MDSGLGEQSFVGTAGIWLICLMLERRKWHGFKNKTFYRQLLEVFFGALLRFRYHLYRSNAPHRGGDFIRQISNIWFFVRLAEEEQLKSMKVLKESTNMRATNAKLIILSFQIP